VVINVLIDAKKGTSNTMAASSLEVFEDGAPQKIESIAGPGTPLSLCILIDVSGSMTSKKDQIAGAAKELVKSLPPGSEVMIWVFADKAYLAVPFTRAEAIDLTLFDRLKFGHHAAINDSVIVAEQHFVQFARYQRRALVLVTDGFDSVSLHGMSDVTHAMELPGSPFVYILEIFDPYRPIPGEHTRIGDFLSPNRAHVEMAGESDAAAQGALDISQCVNRQYALSYRSALIAPDLRLHKIQVKPPAPNPEIRIESLPGYYIPSH
jgi:hypothetical protein